MIIVIKGRNKKQLIIKALSMLALIIMFALYYNHMSNKFGGENGMLANNQSLNIQQKVLDKSMKLEKTIYKESVIIVNLLEQKNVQSIKVYKDKLLIVCDYDTNIEPILIRYGVNAMIKSTSKNIKIAVDLKIIVENKYEA